jgi:hypothetical protein
MWELDFSSPNKVFKEEMYVPDMKELGDGEISLGIDSGFLQLPWVLQKKK